MHLTTALAPLLGFFLCLLAFWSWSRAREAGVSAGLQKKLWDHSKYQRDYEQLSPLEISEALAREHRKYLLLCAASVILALLCFAYTIFMLGGRTAA